MDSLQSTDSPQSTDSLRVTRTEGNPLGALFSCHEGFGVTVTQPVATARLLASSSLARVTVFTEEGLSEAEGANILDAVASAGGRVLAAHHGRSWRDAFRGKHLLMVALDEVDELDSFEKLTGRLDGSGGRVSSTIVRRSAKWSLRGNFANAVLRRDCSLLRLYNSTWAPRFMVDVDELSLCDSFEFVLGLLEATLRDSAVSSARQADTVEAFAEFLRFYSAARDDHRAALAANVALSDLPALRAADVLDDIRHDHI